jgi:hypothetical protein
MYTNKRQIKFISDEDYREKNVTGHVWVNNMRIFLDKIIIQRQYLDFELTSWFSWRTAQLAATMTYFRLLEKEIKTILTLGRFTFILADYSILDILLYYSQVNRLDYIWSFLYFFSWFIWDKLLIRHVTYFYGVHWKSIYDSTRVIWSIEKYYRGCYKG